MREWPPSIFIWTSEYLFSRISGETFSHSNFADLALDVASLVVCYRNRVVPTLLAGFPARVARRKARVFASAAWVKSPPCWGIPKHSQGRPNTATKLRPWCLYLRACLPSSSSLIISLNLVSLVTSRATHHGVCRLRQDE